MNNLGYYILYPILRALSWLPIGVLYVLSDGISWLLFNVIKYRKETIFHNLSIAFPKATEDWKKRIARESMRHFTDIFVEMLKSMTFTPEQMKKRFVYVNPEMLKKYEQEGKPVIVLFAHYASFEWSMTFSAYANFKVYPVYKPLRNKKFNALIQRIRAKFGAELVPMKKAKNIIIEKIKAGERAVFGLIADQSPPRYRAQNFTDFFGRQTAVYRGAEKIAGATDTPVFYLAIEKVKRGYYTGKFVKITEQPREEDDWAITDAYFQLLEDQIHKNPEYYFWTHKRWKVKPENIKRKVFLSPRVR